MIHGNTWQVFKQPFVTAVLYLADMHYSLSSSQELKTEIKQQIPHISNLIDLLAVLILALGPRFLTISHL